MDYDDFYLFCFLQYANLVKKYDVIRVAQSNWKPNGTWARKRFKDKGARIQNDKYRMHTK